MILDRPEEEHTVKNIDSYEREKIETTVKELHLLAGTLKNAVIMLDFAAEKGIKIPERTSLDSIRHPNGIAGPEGNLGKGITELLSMAQGLQVEAAAHIPGEFKSELEKRYIKSE